MNLIKKSAWLMIFAFLLACVFSCAEKEEEEITSESMSGTIVYDIPYYVLKGETVTMSASGIIYPKEVIYKWYIPGIYADTLSARKVSVRFPDSLGVFNVTAISLAPGFYISSTTQNVTTVDTTWNTSLSGLYKSRLTFTDPRDGHTYRYVQAGGLDWFSQNLAWQGTGVPFQSSPATAQMFGSFYTWEEASAACPEGWRLPTQADWESLAAAMSGGVSVGFFDDWKGLGAKASADARLNGERMWPYSPDNLHSNSLGWNAIPLGFGAKDSNDVQGLNEYGCWWTSEEKNADQAYYRYIYYDLDSFPLGFASKDELRVSVRCVRTHPQSL